MGNGFPIAALGGRREHMEAGGLATDDDRVFLLSTTNGPETASLAAFLAVAEAYRTEAPINRMDAAGRRLADAVNAAARDAGIGAYLQAVGRPSCLMFDTRDAEGERSQDFRTLFLQEILPRGVLGQSFVTGAAHSDEVIDRTVDAVRAAMPAYRDALDAGSPERFLRGRPVAPSIRRRAAPSRVIHGHGSPRARTGRENPPKGP